MVCRSSVRQRLSDNTGTAGAHMYNRPSSSGGDAEKLRQRLSWRLRRSQAQAEHEAPRHFHELRKEIETSSPSYLRGPRLKDLGGSESA